jgi:hypothetical protein
MAVVGTAGAGTVGARTGMAATADNFIVVDIDLSPKSRAQVLNPLEII